MSKDRREELRRYYDGVGWQDVAEGLPFDTAVNVGARLRWSGRKRRSGRLGFPQRGRRFLDAGCGANPRADLAAGFGLHVCVDFSRVGLVKALRQLEGRAVGVVADLTRLPLVDGAFGAIWCDSVLFHMTPSDQLRALRELYRVLECGGQLWIGYSKGPHWWLEKVTGCLLRAARRLRRAVGRPGSDAADAPMVVYEPCSPAWWRRSLRRLRLRYRLVPHPWLGRRWTSRMPPFAVRIVGQGLRFACNVVPPVGLLLARRYHIVIHKPGGDAGAAGQ